MSRLATVRQLALSTLVIALGTAAAVTLVSCGGGEDAKLLPGTTAQEITENLDRVKQYAEEGECVGAANAASEVHAQVEAVSGIDAQLKNALQHGADRLDEVVATCEEETTETEPLEEEPSEEDEEPQPDEGKAAEKEREKEEKALEKEEEKAEKEAEKTEEKEGAPPETTPEGPSTTVPPSEGGGTGAPGGVSPGTPVGPGGEG